MAGLMVFGILGLYPGLIDWTGLPATGKQVCLRFLHHIRAAVIFLLGWLAL